MSDVITYNNIIDIFEDISQRHFQIKEFFVGDEWEEDANERDYPLLVVNPTSANMERADGVMGYATFEITMDVIVSDLVYKGEENEKEVHSDTLQMIQDIIVEFNQHPYYTNSRFDIIGDLDFEPFTERGDDDVTGWICEMTLRTPNIRKFCGIPVSEIDGFEFDRPDGSTSGAAGGSCLCIKSVTGNNPVEIIESSGHYTWDLKDNFITGNAPIVVDSTSGILGDYIINLSNDFIVASTAGTGETPEQLPYIFSNLSLNSVIPADSVGTYNSINSNSDSSAILGGNFNQIFSTGDNSVIVNGKYTSINSPYCAILTGFNSTIGTISQYSFLGSGVNIETNQSKYSFIGAGKSANIFRSNYSTIVSGSSNTISGTTGTTHTHNSIVGGNSGSISNSIKSVISGGEGNTIEENTYYGGIGSGYMCKLKSATSSFIGGGITNYINGAIGASILAGRDNTITGGAAADYSSIVAGNSNTITDSANALISGLSNTITSAAKSTVFGASNTVQNCEVASIVGGENNGIDGAYYTFIGGGVGNNINSGEYSTITGGVNNTLTGSNSHIIGGNNCTINNNRECTIINGDFNIIQNSAENSNIIGSRRSQIDNSPNSNIIGSSLNYTNNTGNFNITNSRNASIIANKAWGYYSIYGDILNSQYSMSLHTVALISGTGSSNFGGNDVIGGYYHKVYNSDYSSIIGCSGYGRIDNGKNTIIIGAKSSRQTISSNSEIKASLIAGGDGHTMTDSDYSSIIGGKSQTMTNSDYASLIGTNNTLSGGDKTIILGCNNYIYTSNSIIGGQYHKTNNSADYSTIFGFANGIGTSPFNTIGPGEADTKFNIIAGGFTNYIRQYNSVSGIFSGNENDINSDYATIIGGKDNTINSNSDYSVIIGGETNTIDGSKSVVIGSDSSAGANNCIVIGNNVYGTNGGVYLENLRIHDTPETTTNRDAILQRDSDMVVRTVDLEPRYFKAYSTDETVNNSAKNSTFRLDFDDENLNSGHFTLSSTNGTSGITINDDGVFRIQAVYTYEGTRDGARDPMIGQIEINGTTESETYYGYNRDLQTAAGNCLIENVIMDSIFEISSGDSIKILMTKLGTGDINSLSGETYITITKI